MAYIVETTEAEVIVKSYVFIEYPKWVNGVIVQDAEEEAAVMAAAESDDPAPDDKPRRGRPPKSAE